MTTERSVKVWQKLKNLSVLQKSETEWIAIGHYNGEHIEVEGRSASVAVKNWIEAARFRDD